MILPVLYSISVVVLIGSVIVGLIVFVVNMLRNKSKDMILDMKTLWIAYLYLMSLIALLVALFGATRFLKAGASYLFGPEFSYTMNENVEVDLEDRKLPVEETWLKDMEKVEIDGKEYYFDDEERKSDLIDGATLFLSLIILFAIHRSISMRLDGKDENLTSIWSRVYNFASLALYGILSLIVIPTAIYSCVRYFVDKGTMVGVISASLPGEALAALIVIVPVWLIFLSRMVNHYQKK